MFETLPSTISKHKISMPSASETVYLGFSQEITIPDGKKMMH